MNVMIRDWRMDVKYETGLKGESIPIGSKPYEGTDREYFTKSYNLGRKFDEKVGLNWKEKSELGGVCSIGPEQVVQCYGPGDCGKGFTIYELECLCDTCPYAIVHDAKADRTNYSIWFPFFLEKWMSINNIGQCHEDQKWFVYFVSDSRYVKIGKGCVSNDRISQLQTGNPCRIMPLFRVYVDSEKEAFTVETYLHQIYSDYQMEGEWYDILDRLSINKWQQSIMNMGG